VTRVWHAVRAFPGRALVGLIRGYQLVVSPLLGRRCRYYPTCSAYAIEAIRVHGPLRGCLLGAWRVLRCNPFSNGRLDPVPPRGEHRHCRSAGVS